MLSSTVNKSIVHHAVTTNSSQQPHKNLIFQLKALAAREMRLSFCPTAF